VDASFLSGKNPAATVDRSTTTSALADRLDASATEKSTGREPSSFEKVLLRDEPTKSGKPQKEVSKDLSKEIKKDTGKEKDSEETASALVSLFGQNPGLSGTPILNFLTGRVDRLEPSKIPQIVVQSDFVKKALGGAGVMQFMSTSQPLGSLLNNLGLDESVAGKLQALGGNPNQTLTPRELFETMGVDPSRVLAELEILRDRLPIDGFQPYMARSAALRGQTQYVPDTARDAALGANVANVAGGASTAESSVSVQNAATGVTNVPTMPGMETIPASPKKPAAINTTDGLVAAIPTHSPSAPGFIAAPSLGGGLQENVKTLPSPMGGMNNNNLPFQNDGTTLRTEVTARAVTSDPFAELGEKLSLARTFSAAPKASDLDVTGTTVSANSAITTDMLAARDSSSPLASAFTLALPDATATADVNGNTTAPVKTPAGMVEFDLRRLDGDGIQARMPSRQVGGVSGISGNAGNELGGLPEFSNSQSLFTQPNLSAPTLTNARSPLVEAGVIGISDRVHTDETAGIEGSGMAFDLENVAATLGRNQNANSKAIEARATGGIPTLGDWMESSRFAVTSLTDAREFSGDQMGRDGDEQPADTESLLTGDLREVGLSTGDHGVGRIGHQHFTEALTVDSNVMTAADRQQLLQKISDSATMMIREGGSSMRMALGTPELGKLDVAISLSQDRVDVRIMAANDQVRDLLNREVPRLRDSLGLQNLNLGSVEVGVGGGQHNFTQSGGFSQNWSNGNGGMGQWEGSGAGQFFRQNSQQVSSNVRDASRRIPSAMQRLSQMPRPDAGRIQVLA